MKTITLIVAPLLAFAATLASAQPPPSSHEQHQATEQHQLKAVEGRCCCEQVMREMHEMMSEMMKMHQGMAAPTGHDEAKDKRQEQPKY